MKTTTKSGNAVEIALIQSAGRSEKLSWQIVLLTITMIFAGLTLFANKNTNKLVDMKHTGSGYYTGDNHVAQTKESQAATSPQEAVNMLKEGNKRFVKNKMNDTDYLAQVKQTSTGQYPVAAVVSCIDSRIPTEIVFDQGVGDIFNARIAGNFVNTDILGSLEFACKVAGAKAIVVMGHTSCGAVMGAADGVEMGNLTAMLDNLEPAVNAVDDIQDNRTSKNSEFVQKIADKNVELTIEKIKSDSAILKEMYDNGEITIVGAMYDVGTGKVTFMN